MESVINCWICTTAALYQLFETQFHSLGNMQSQKPEKYEHENSKVTS
jgi:hypothetical protein